MSAVTRPGLTRRRPSARHLLPSNRTVARAGDHLARRPPEVPQPTRRRAWPPCQRELKDATDHCRSKPPLVTGSVDTHLDTHVAAALDTSTGCSGPTASGYRHLLRWLMRLRRGRPGRLGGHR